jgi:hypothetical protein
MKENISVEATCCTHSLNKTFRCVIRYYSFFAAVMHSRIWANSSLPYGSSFYVMLNML